MVIYLKFLRENMITPIIMQELLIFLFEIAPTESNYQQIKSEIVSNALTSSSVEDENTTEEEESS